jgi:CheY-like chemotaxis protein
MVYGFAKQSDGAFRLNSEVGSGTTAELWLPRAPDNATQRKEVKSEPQVISSRKLRIMLVDDHAEVRSATAGVLEELGHQVVEAANGAEALEALKARECDYDVIVSDYAMPHLSGTDFLIEARKLCPKVPALIITGYVDGDAISDRPEGVEILPKPFTPHKLEAALSRVCETCAVAG